MKSNLTCFVFYDDGICLRFDLPEKIQNMSTWSLFFQGAWRQMWRHGVCLAWQGRPITAEVEHSITFFLFGCLKYIALQTMRLDEIVIAAVTCPHVTLIWALLIKAIALLCFKFCSAPVGYPHVGNVIRCITATYKHRQKTAVAMRTACKLRLLQGLGKCLLNHNRDDRKWVIEWERCWKKLYLTFRAIKHSLIVS